MNTFKTCIKKSNRYSIGTTSTATTATTATSINGKNNTIHLNYYSSICKNYTSSSSLSSSFEALLLHQQNITRRRQSLQPQPQQHATPICLNRQQRRTYYTNNSIENTRHMTFRTEKHRCMVPNNHIRTVPNYSKSFSSLSTTPTKSNMQHHQQQHQQPSSTPEASKVSSSESVPSESVSVSYSPIYVAATRQHVGKTTTSLALLNGLMERFPKNRVGFIKPVGQQSVKVNVNVVNNTSSLTSSTTTTTTTREVMVDKDAALVKQYYQLENLSYEDISPVLIPPGYTRQYIDGTISFHDQMNKIQTAFHTIQSCNDIVLCEGTGHVAVGSIGMLQKRFFCLVFFYLLFVSNYISSSNDRFTTILLLFLYSGCKQCRYCILIEC
jgi:hypothetical protein